MMSFKEEWIPAPQCTIEQLAAQGCARYFQHNDIIYLGFMEPEPISEGEGIWYKAIVRNARKPTRFWGSVVVTPLSRGRVDSAT